MQLPQVGQRRIVILTDGFSDPITAKTAVSMVRYCKGEVVAILDREKAGKTSQDLFGIGGDIPVVATLDEARLANTLVIGIAPPGGKIPETWKPVVLHAIQLGLHVVSGLHEFLGDDTELAAASAQHGVEIWDVRRNDERTVATGEEFNTRCLRIHTIGNDCCVGKMVVTIELTQELKRRGHDAHFVATGQTGMMISGEGCPVDCVTSDFVNGAVERLMMSQQHREISLIEGQGSLAHPAYSSVSLGLLHGCRPHGLILCYEAGRTHLHGWPSIPVPGLDQIRELGEMMAAFRHSCRVIGVAMNSRRLTESEAIEERGRISDELSLPVCDVIRDGPNVLVEAVLALRKE